MASRGDYADYGFVTLEHPLYPDGTPFPKFYAHALLAVVIGDKVIQTSVVTGDGTKSTVHAYASSFSNGQVGLVLINEHSYDSVRIKIKGMASSRNATANAWVLSGQEIIRKGNESFDPLNSTDIFWNSGIATYTEGFIQSPTTQPPYWLDATPEGAFTMVVPPACVVGLIAYS